MAYCENAYVFYVIKTLGSLLYALWVGDARHTIDFKLIDHSMIMKKYLFFSIFLSLALTANAQQYQLNPEQSGLSWTGRAAYSAYTLGGTIQARSGTLSCEGERILQGELAIDMQSIQSDIGQLTKHLRSADFFEVKRFPEAHFTLGQPFTPGSTAGTASGMLTIKGIAKEEKIQLTARREGKTLRLEGKAAIDRTAYGIYYNSPSFFEGLKQEAIANDFELAFKLVFEEMEKE